MSDRQPPLLTSEPETYAFPNALEVQRDRMRSLEALLDPGTIALLEARGVAQGWRCLEAGAGGGSITAWLCAQVGRSGSVLAVDLDTTLLGELACPNLEVRTHDVVADELPAGEFDLVHLRLLLAWLAEPRVALDRLIAALKPGAWLLAEEMDFISVAPDPHSDPHDCDVFTRVVHAHNAVLAAEHTFDAFYGRRVMGELRAAGLVDVGCEARASMWHGGDAGGNVWRLTFAQLREPMVASGLVSPVEVDEAIELCGDPRFSFLSQVTVAAWGRVPPGWMTRR